jgi:HopA1 effector protein family
MSKYQQTLIEIIEKIEIDRDFSVRHPDYPPLELDPDSISIFQQIAPELQTKYAIIQIQNYLYDLYFSHCLLSLNQIELTAAQPAQIKNNIVDGIDIDFYQKLQQSNTSKGYLDPHWQVIAITDDGELIVVKERLHLHINRQRHLPTDSQQVNIGDVVAIYLPNSLVGEDTYIIVGNCGTPGTGKLPNQDRSPSVDLYFNFTPDAAVSIAQQLTMALNQLDIPFQFAILHDPDLFHCYDAGTLWISQAGYLQAQTVIADIYRSHSSEFSNDIPLFTKQLAPGLGFAEVLTTDNFGMQRCKLLATGLFVARDLDLSSAEKLKIVCQEFTTAGIDWLQPYLNFSELDDYPSFLAKTNTIKSD